MFEPGVGCDGSFAAVAVVVEQLFALIDVSRCHQDEVRYPVDIMEFGLTVAVLTVVDQTTHAPRFFRGVHTRGRCSRENPPPAADIRLI